MKLITRLIHQSAKADFNISTTAQLHPKIPSHAFLLHACSNIRTLEEGRPLHAQMLVTGIEQNDYSGSKLVGMYAKSGSPADARLIFEKIPRRNVNSWNAMIRGYVDHGDLKEALLIYNQMQTMVDVAHQVFDRMSKRNIVAWTAMIAGYVQNGLAEESMECFRQMHLKSIKPCVVSIAGVLPACAQVMALRQGILPTCAEVMALRQA